MAKLTRSLLIIKERNCTASMVLDVRTNRRNVTDYPLAIRFTVDRKFFYHPVGGSFSERRFSEICNATKSSSDNYKEQKRWREVITPKYKELLENLNKGYPLTFEMVRVAVMTGNFNVGITQEEKSFTGIWEEYIHHLQTDNDGKHYTTSESYIYALKSFKRILGEDAVKGFNISVVEIQKWKDGMRNGVKDKDGNTVGKISDSTAGIYLRSCRAIWNLCRSQGYLQDVTYPFSNKKEKRLVSIPKSKSRKKLYLKREQMTELYNHFIAKDYLDTWNASYINKAHYSLGLFLVQYLCNGFNLADAARLQYNDYYYQNEGKAFLFNRKKTADRSAGDSEVVIPIIEPLQKILDEIAAAPTRGGYVFPEIFHGATSERERRKRTSQENANIRHRVTRICHEVLHWDKSICPSGTWCRHSFATNLRNVGVEKNYIDESMGHSCNGNDMTDIYLDTYPLEKQMEYNMRLLIPNGYSSEREELLAKLSSLSNKELIKLLAKAL
ncbi:MAG: integrase [Prevotella sp.]|nr:integrase [Prevotella sp.]